LLHDLLYNFIFLVFGAAVVAANFYKPK